MSNDRLEFSQDSNFYFTDSSVVTHPLLQVFDEEQLCCAESADIYDNPTLLRDIRNRAQNQTSRSIKELVETYYEVQQLRLSVAGRFKTIQSIDGPSQLLEYYAQQLRRIESSFIKPLHTYAKKSTTGQWALSQHGIGPVIAAGLLAYVDITKAPTAGSVWRYAGLDPSVKATKSNKRSWNPDLKTLSWKIGLSFARFAEHDECYYGHLYLHDKQRRLEKNAAGDYASAAQAALHATTTVDPELRDVLLSGQLPVTQIDAQARRYAVKIFLSHYHAVAYQEHYHIAPSRPYIIERNNSYQELSIPHFPF